jgi:hypothetical protein
MKSGQQTTSPRRLLLRDICRNTFYRGPGDWNAEIEQAMNFTNIQELISISERCEISDAEVVEHLPDGRLDFQIAVSDGSELVRGTNL